MNENCFVGRRGHGFCKIAHEGRHGAENVLSFGLAVLSFFERRIMSGKHLERIVLAGTSGFIAVAGTEA